ncbi:hypothetical protein [Aeromonas caviae]|uniref:hypothetical protein n=1 Tax=Aeromonas caviae TaxID=648 RepID=UPI0038CFCFE7
MNYEFHEKSFNAAMRVAEIAIERGYAKAWFSWIEWVTLTAVLFSAAKSASSNITMLAAIISALLLLFVALSSISHLIKDIATSVKFNKIWLWALFMLPVLATPAIVLAIMHAILKSLSAQ